MSRLTRFFLTGLVLLVVGSTGCGQAAAPASKPSDSASEPVEAIGAKAADQVNQGNGPPLPTFQVCDSAPRPRNLSTERFRRFRSLLITRLGDWHSAQDAISTPSKPAAITGKFTYGPTSKDLEGETIEAWIDDCSGSYQKLGRARTNGDGRSSLTVTSADMPGPGAYGIYQRVVGDNTWTHSMLRVLPEDTKLIVFDIDNTLTAGNIELAKDVFADIFEPILHGDYVPNSRQDAAEITWLRRLEQGYQVVYLTGRPYWLMHRTRGWLTDQAAAPGVVHLTNSDADALPVNSQVGDYKADYIEHLQSLGLDINAAYGNSGTDIYAYARAGIPLNRTYIVGPEGGNGGTVDLGAAYTSHLANASAEPDAVQPFNYQ